jgi:hypothetical protein
LGHETPNTVTKRRTDMRSLEDRARTAYWRRFGDGADIPSVSVDETLGVVELYNVRGVLGAYRITDRGLRWDEKLAKRLQRERERSRSRRMRETNG